MTRLIKKIPTVKATVNWVWEWKWLFVGIAALVFLIATPLIWPGGWGINSGESIVTTIEEDPKGNIVKKTETTTPSSGKSLWDGLSLLGVPLVLALLGAWFQNAQRKQATDEAREEVLQLYFDRISTLLIDKNLIAIASKGDDASPESKELLESSLDVIRARTLSILRRFEEDIDRKTSVIRFLAEAEIISKLQLNLRGANLVGAKLNWANLEGAKFTWANFEGTNLVGANLVGANFEGANLVGAKLYRANLAEANLEGANLEGANLYQVRFNNNTAWPVKEEVTKAQNIPSELKAQLGLTPKSPPTKGPQ